MSKAVRIARRQRRARIETFTIGDDVSLAHASPDGNVGRGLKLRNENQGPLSFGHRPTATSGAD